MPEVSRDTAALWCMHTYLLDCFQVSPRLAIRSPTRRCGKTTLKDVLSRLVYRALPTDNVTSSTVFRVVEAHRPTLLIDEADTFLRDNDGLRGVLNSGHGRNGFVLRGVGDDFEPRRFSTYSACAIGMIGKLPDTLHDRSVVIDLKRRLPSEWIEQFRLGRAAHLDTLARQIARWAKDHAGQMANSDPDMPPGIHNREADNWRPLLAIADVAGGHWPELARSTAERSCHIAGGDDDDRAGILLCDIKTIFTEQNTDRISSANLVEALVKIEGRPWAEYGKTGKPHDPGNQLARALKPLGVSPDNIRVNGAAVLKGYRPDHFKEAFSRYLGSEGGSQPLHRYNADEIRVLGGFQNATGKDDVAVEKCEKPNNHAVCSGVAVCKGVEALARVCVHCGQPERPDDPIQACHVNGDAYLLHRACQRDWKPDDGLDIPEYLRRTGG